MWRTLSRIKNRFIASSKLKDEKGKRPCFVYNEGKTAKTVVPTNYFVPLQYFKSCCCGSDYSKEKNRRNYKARQGGPFYQIKHDWLDAVGWSGVLLLSCYICQPFCCRRVRRNPAESITYERWHKTFSLEYASLVQCLSQYVIESPAKYVLPTVNAVKFTKYTSATDERAEALRQDCDNLETAHKKVISSLKNIHGTKCMQEGKHDKAFAYFIEAADANHSSALFNLGICYEMGLGTKQCFIKAAESYKKASDLGHATAMYNLGVFYIHGWGGVDADSKKARQLFTAAARLGQLDARHALNFTDTMELGPIAAEQDSLSNMAGRETEIIVREVIEPKSNDLTDLWFKVLNIKLDNLDYNKSEIFSSEDSGVNDLSPANDVDFLKA